MRHQGWSERRAITGKMRKQARCGFARESFQDGGKWLLLVFCGEGAIQECCDVLHTRLSGVGGFQRGYRVRNVSDQWKPELLALVQRTEVCLTRNRPMDFDEIDPNLVQGTHRATGFR